jgi:hypothetical protein
MCSIVPASETGLNDTEVGTVAPCRFPTAPKELQSVTPNAAFYVFLCIMAIIVLGLAIARVCL